MKLQQYLLHHYLNTEFEDFSHRSVSALGILLTIKNSPFGAGDKKVEEAINEIKDIVKRTDKETDVSLFVLDRNIVPQNVAKGVEYKTTFTRNTKRDTGQTITLGQDEIQRRLCNALMRIHEIVMEQIAGYSEQINMESGMM